MNYSPSGSSQKQIMVQGGLKQDDFEQHDSSPLYLELGHRRDHDICSLPCHSPSKNCMCLYCRRDQALGREDAFLGHSFQDSHNVTFVASSPETLDREDCVARARFDDKRDSKLRQVPKKNSAEGVLPKLRKNKKEKVNKMNNKSNKVDKLDHPISELTKDWTNIPVVDIEKYVNRSVEMRQKEVGDGKNPGKVKRPMNSFMLYRKAYQNRIKNWCLQNNHQVVSQVCGQSWPLEPDSVKLRFTKWAQIERENHQKAHPGYKFSPNKPSTTKTNKRTTSAVLITDDSDSEDRIQTLYSSKKQRGCDVDLTEFAPDKISSVCLINTSEYHRRVSSPQSVDSFNFHDNQRPSSYHASSLSNQSSFSNSFDMERLREVEYHEPSLPTCQIPNFHDITWAKTTSENPRYYHENHPPLSEREFGEHETIEFSNQIGIPMFQEQRYTTSTTTTTATPAIADPSIITWNQMLFTGGGGGSNILASHQLSHNMNTDGQENLPKSATCWQQLHQYPSMPHDIMMQYPNSELSSEMLGGIKNYRPHGF